LQIAELTEEEYQRRLELEKLKIKIEQTSKGEDSDDGEEEGGKENGGATGGVNVKSSMYVERRPFERRQEVRATVTHVLLLVAVTGVAPSSFIVTF